MSFTFEPPSKPRKPQPQFSAEVERLNKALLDERLGLIGFVETLIARNVKLVWEDIYYSNTAEFLNTLYESDKSRTTYPNYQKYNRVRKGHAITPDTARQLSNMCQTQVEFDRLKKLIEFQWENARNARGQNTMEADSERILLNHEYRLLDLFDSNRRTLGFLSACVFAPFVEDFSVYEVNSSLFMRAVNSSVGIKGISHLHAAGRRSFGDLVKGIVDVIESLASEDANADGVVGPLKELVSAATDPRSIKEYAAQRKEIFRRTTAGLHVEAKVRTDADFQLGAPPLFPTGWCDTGKLLIDDSKAIKIILVLIRTHILKNGKRDPIYPFFEFLSGIERVKNTTNAMALTILPTAPLGPEGPDFLKDLMIRTSRSYYEDHPCWVGLSFDEELLGPHNFWNQLTVELGKRPALELDDSDFRVGVV